MAPKCPNPWSKSTDTVLKELQVDPQVGVSDDLEARRAHYGFNELEKQPGTSVWQLILEQFNDTLVKVGQGGVGEFGCVWGGVRCGGPDAFVWCVGVALGCPALLSSHALRPADAFDGIQIIWMWSSPRHSGGIWRMVTS